MEDLDILSKMIKKEAFVNVDAVSRLVMLSEPQAPDSIVTIKGLPSDTLVVKGDMFRSPDTIFEGSKGECKRADYILISAVKRCILCVEMKRKKGDAEDTVRQLKGLKCFVKYCQEIGKVFWEKEGFLDGYEQRYVSFRHTNISIPKTPTYIGKSGNNNSPELVLTVSHPGIQLFNKLVGTL